ncbi:MAG: rhamnulokinase [Phycisphaerae bacterium]|nr:rhamnulokinase [Phycisphaerae bacterium]
MATRGSIAIDLGAESGRVMVGVLRAGGLSLHEAHRFLHAPVATSGAPAWDLPLIWREIREGLKRAAAWAVGQDVEIASVGVDTWGVDFALLGKGDELLATPRCYRNSEHAEGLAILDQRLGRAGVYGLTGVRSMALNTSSQLAGWVARDPGVFRAAGRLLFMPDLLHYMLGGVASTEQSIASTSQMLDARTRDWSVEVLRAIGLPRDILPTIVQPGTALGPVRREITEETGLPASVMVIAPAAHDTASAVVGTPLSGSRCCYLSSGTWSLLGVELDRPILSEESRAADFSNEHGVDGTTRFLKNVIGLWLVQEIKRDLARSGVDMSYEQLAGEAERATPFRSRVDVEAPELALAGDMIRKVRALARSTGDPEPGTPGELVRACLEGLAGAYARTLEQIERLTGRAIGTIHVIGGGVKNTLLCQMTASATGRRVLAGPGEATAMGNLLVQMMALGEVAGLARARELVSRSCRPVEYLPASGAGWERLTGRAVESSR